MENVSNIISREGEKEKGLRKLFDHVVNESIFKQHIPKQVESDYEVSTTI